MQVKDVVRVVSCDECPTVVGKTGVIKSFDEENSSLAIVSFGRGRPQKNRPYKFPVDALELVKLTESAAS